MILPPNPANVALAAALLHAGDVVAFPTETVYGLGADATNPDAVARIFEVKGRPRFDPLIVHVASLAHVYPLVRAIPPAALRLAERFWPGPLTIVLPKTDRVPDIVTAGLSTVALRVPDHPVALDLLRAAPGPLAAPSANPFGYVSPTRADHVDEQIGTRVPLVLDGGPCRVGIESTIITFVDDNPALLRPGGIPAEEIEDIAGPIRTVSIAAAERVAAPGQLPSHYAPRTPLTLVGSVAGIPPTARAHAALLACTPVADVSGFAHVEVLAGEGELRRAAADLFAALRRLDASGYTRLFAVAVPERGLGRAIMDRLRRAAAAASPAPSLRPTLE